MTRQASGPDVIDRSTASQPNTSELAYATQKLMRSTCASLDRDLSSK